MTASSKILQIGNYPPPMCGWAIQTKLVTDELRRRGHVCEVLKINQNRKVKNPAYIDVQGGFDYLRKVMRYARRGYRLNVHMNGMGRTGYLLALAAVIIGRLVNRPALVTFHGGAAQNNFPRYDWSLEHWAYKLLFYAAGMIACDDRYVKEAIERYGVPPRKVTAIATFSAQYLDFHPAPLPAEAEEFLQSHRQVFFSYNSFRPEYRLEVLREAMKQYRSANPDAGFIWLGFPGRELDQAQNFVRDWPQDERQGLLLLGNLTHDQFLTLLSRSFAFLRTPACDGVCASVLESLALGIPVVASENSRRPQGVITYADTDAADMCRKLMDLAGRYDEVKSRLRALRGEEEDNVGRMADWLAGERTAAAPQAAVAVS